uniref:Uncharacterized protein n=1 Tax=Marseillevirus LCMAC102 TaxID=2506603 RepID=A0A481YUT7_9VIRU|nr:MAG: hypothetical protein LCMAC102_00610 [Marseillevirus LCMAC102]
MLPIWKLKDQDLDNTFIGQWEVTCTDDYDTPKAGTSIRTAVVRSKVDLENEIVRLYSYLTPRFGVDNIPMDGSVGVYGKITERSRVGVDSITRTDFLWIQSISPSDIKYKIQNIDGEKDKYTLLSTAEFDDVVFNAIGEYTFPITYHLKGEKIPMLWGLSIEIPLQKFNHYIRMRNLWYRDYEGAKIIVP